MQKKQNFFDMWRFVFFKTGIEWDRSVAISLCVYVNGLWNFVSSVKLVFLNISHMFPPTPIIFVTTHVVNDIGTSDGELLIKPGKPHGDKSVYTRI